MPEILHTAYDNLYLAALLALAVMILLCMIRAIKGPRIADRIVSINMICTMVIASICILSVKLNESTLLDVALIYALLGFVAVIVLTKVYMGIHAEKLAQQAAEKQEKEAQES